MTQTHRLLAGAPGLASVASSSFDVVTSPVIDHPNEPAGFTKLTELRRSLAPSAEDGWSTNGNGNLSFPAKVPFERVTATSMALDYHGITPGNGPITTWKSIPPALEVYLDYDYCMQSDYNANQSQNKWWFLCPQPSASGLIIGHHVNGGGFGNAQPKLSIQNCATFQGSLNNAGGTRIISDMQGGSGGSHFVTRDSIVRYIWYFKMNSVGDIADGIVRMWAGLNGATPTQRIECTNMAVRGTGSGFSANAKFFNLKWAPTYGGTATQVPDGFQRLCYLYASYKQ